MSAPGNCWDTIAVFNQCTLKNVFGGRHDISNPNLHVAVDGITDQQKLDAIMFLEGDMEQLAHLPDGNGLQTVVDVQALLEILSTNNILYHQIFFSFSDQYLRNKNLTYWFFKYIIVEKFEFYFHSFQ